MNGDQCRRGRHYSHADVHESLQIKQFKTLKGFYVFKFELRQSPVPTFMRLFNYYFQNVLDCVHELVGTDGEVSAFAAGNLPFSVLHVSVDLTTVTAIHTSSTTMLQINDLHSNDMLLLIYFIYSTLSRTENMLQKRSTRK